MKYLIIVFLSLLMMNFFGAFEIQDKVFFYIMMPFVFLKFSSTSIYKNLFIYLVVFLFVNILSCQYLQGQPIFLTFKATIPFVFIIFYYLLRYFNLSVEGMEKIFFILTFSFGICYLVQYIVYPTIIFSDARIMHDVSAQGLRMRLTGQGLSSLGYFFALTNILNKNKKNRIINIILLVLCFSVIFLMGFRTMITFILIMTIATIIKINGFNWKLFTYSTIIVIAVNFSLQTKVVSKVLDQMAERQETENLNNEDYIRITQFVYFTQNHFNSIGEYIIGSGAPSMGVEASSYGRKMNKLQSEGINWVDWGLLSLSWIIGIPAVLVMIFYSFKVILLKLPVDYFYVKIWFIYLLLSSFTTMEFYRAGNFIIQAMVLYIAEKAHKKYSNNLNLKNTIKL
jgi:hypothetical protein